MGQREPAALFLVSLVLAAALGGAAMAAALVAGTALPAPYRAGAPPATPVSTPPLARGTAPVSPAAPPANTPALSSSTTAAPHTPAASVTATASPRATASPTPAGLTLEVVSATARASPGGRAQVVVRTGPEAACEITVQFPTGPSRAAGLDPQRADANGIVTWSWLVGPTTAPGEYSILIVCARGAAQARLTLPFEIR